MAAEVAGDVGIEGCRNDVKVDELDGGAGVQEPEKGSENNFLISVASLG